MCAWVKSGTCGTCKDFEFKGNDQKGYCTRYGVYYWDDDSCEHWEPADGYSFRHGNFDPEGRQQGFLPPRG